MDGSQGDLLEALAEGTRLEPAAVRRFLSDNPEFLTGDDGLLDELGLKGAACGNVVEFAPAAMARINAAQQRDGAHPQGRVAYLLHARNHAHPARRVDELAQQRFGLAAGVIALETEGASPA